MSMQEHADRNLWSEIDTMLASLAHQSAEKLGLQVRSSRLKNVDWEDLLPRFKHCGTLARVPWTIGSDNHPLSPYFDGPEPFLGHHAAQNKYWETVDRIHRSIEADTTLRKLEGWKNRSTDTTSLAEKIRRRNVKKRRAVARPV